jgi:hypothetical protein
MRPFAPVRLVVLGGTSTGSSRVPAAMSCANLAIATETAASSVTTSVS